MATPSIRTLTIIEITHDDGKRDYSLNGNLPLEDAVKGIVISAYHIGNTAKKELPRDSNDGLNDPV